MPTASWLRQTDLPLDSQGRRYIDPPNLDQILDQFVNWRGNVNGGGHTLSNVVMGGGISIGADGLTMGGPLNMAGFPIQDAGAMDADSLTLRGTLDMGGNSILNAVIGAGSSIPWTNVTGKPANFQTPWGQDIDAAAFSLRNAGFILGSNVAAQLVGYNIYYDGAWKKQQDGPGVAIIKYPGGSASALYTSPTVTGATIPIPTAAMIFRDDGLIELARHTDAAGNSFRNAGYIVQKGDYGHSWNLDVSSGQWRHVANGYGNVVAGGMGDGYLRIYTTPSSGAAGAIASLSVTTMFGPNDVWFKNRLTFDNATGDRIRFWGGTNPGFNIGVESGALYQTIDSNCAFRWYQGIAADTVSAAMELTSSGVLRMRNANGERIRVYDAGGINHAIGIEANTMWFQAATNSQFRWYVGTAPDNGASAKVTFTATELLADYVIAVTGQNGHSWNAKWAGNWYYLGPGNAPASMMYCDTATGGLRWLIGPTGSPGQIVPFVTAMEIWNGGVAMKLVLLLNACPTSPSGQLSGTVWRDAAAGNVLKIVP